MLKLNTKDVRAFVRYPINTLRNVAIDAADTNWVFPLDADFEPTVTLYGRLKSMLGTLSKVFRPAVVVPHFELTPNLVIKYVGQYRKKSKVISQDQWVRWNNFAELIGSLHNGTIIPFQGNPSLLWSSRANILGVEGNKNHLLPPEQARYFDFDHKYGVGWSQGVEGSDYERWYNASLKGDTGCQRIYPAEVGLGALSKDFVHFHTGPQFRRLDIAPNWEPYVLGRKREPDGHELPRYTEGFYGRFLNKLEWVLSLQAQRYTFFNLPGDFLMHQPHQTKFKFRTDE